MKVGLLDRREFIKGAVAGAALAAAPGLARAQGAKIRVGLMLPYTGTFAPLGVAIENGFRLALEQAHGQERLVLRSHGRRRSHGR